MALMRPGRRNVSCAEIGSTVGNRVGKSFEIIIKGLTKLP